MQLNVLCIYLEKETNIQTLAMTDTVPQTK